MARERAQSPTEARRARLGDIIWIRAALAAAIIGGMVEIRPFDWAAPVCVLVGIAITAAVIWFEVRLNRASLKRLIGAAAGSVLGIFGAYLISLILHAAGLRAVLAGDISLLALAVMTYIGLIVGAEKGDFLNLAALGGLFSPERLRRGGKLLDTSAIIDGRLADIAETGFLEGPLWIPHFVLRELQTIADSSDGAKRQRGRRGLDILQRLQQIPGLEVRVLEEEPVRAREVDHQLVETARLHDCKIITNDFNLNKLAQLQHVAVLNVNELANAMKTVVLAGEILRVQITKEGKESGQGVGYLDDGTLVVVEQGRRLISRCADVVVTSVLQTPAGKMVFARASEERGDYRPIHAAEAGGGQ